MTDLGALVKRLKSFEFHNEISMDGVAVSVLFSRCRTSRPAKLHIRSALEGPRSKAVGVDPGRKNLITMMDSVGISLRYTSRQRLFESKLIRYRRVLELEKSRRGKSICPNMITGL